MASSPLLEDHELQKRVLELEAALTPFAIIGCHIPSGLWDEETEIGDILGHLPEFELTVGDFHHAFQMLDIPLFDDEDEEDD